MSAVARRTAAIVALGLLVALVAGPTRASAERSDHLSYLTFTRQVALPGVTLQPGTYAFEIASPDTAANVVVVRDRSRTKALFSGFTSRVPRPANWSAKRPLVFGESAPDQPAPILAWYPVDNDMGYEFSYRR